MSSTLIAALVVLVAAWAFAAQQALATWRVNRDERERLRKADYRRDYERTFGHDRTIPSGHLGVAMSATSAAHFSYQPGAVWVVNSPTDVRVVDANG